MPTNRASWLMAKTSPVNVVDAAPYTAPSVDEVVIETKAIAINPADVIIQKLGVLIEDYPAILGCDVAGEVVDVGPSSRYKVGDRVIGLANCLKRKNDAYCYSGFQTYVVLKEPSIARIPSNITYEDAAVLPLGITTAGSCLFAGITLGLAPPSIESKHGSGTLLIWGASSSVGSCGVQLASQAGYEVVGVASKRNHDMVLGLGASKCFDQIDSPVNDIVEYLKGREVVGAFSAIAQESTLDDICEILDRSGARKLLSSIIPGAESKASKGVKIVTNFAVDLEGREITGIWQWLTEAMRDDLIQYKPPSTVFGQGLEKVQGAVDLLAEGVSAKKLVVTIWG